MCNVLVITQSCHQTVEYLRCPLQAEVFGHTRITETETWYGRCNHMESLLCAVAEARERMRVIESVDDALHLDE